MPIGPGWNWPSWLRRKLQERRVRKDRENTGVLVREYQDPDYRSEPSLGQKVASGARGVAGAVDAALPYVNPVTAPSAWIAKGVRDRAGRDEFKDWYSGHADDLGLDPDPSTQLYDYQSAYEAEVEPDEAGHWPSEFKLPGHPNLVVDGVDTRTGDVIPEGSLARAMWEEREGVRERWHEAPGWKKQAVSAGVGVSRLGSAALAEMGMGAVGLPTPFKTLRQANEEGVIQTKVAGEMVGMGAGMIGEIAGLKGLAGLASGAAPAGSALQGGLSLASRWAHPSRKITAGIGAVEGLASDIGMYAADPSSGWGWIPGGMVLGAGAGFLTPLKQSLRQQTAEAMRRSARYLDPGDVRAASQGHFADLPPSSPLDLQHGIYEPATIGPRTPGVESEVPGGVLTPETMPGGPEAFGAAQVQREALERGRFLLPGEEGEYLLGPGGLLEAYGTGAQIAKRTGIGAGAGAAFGAAVSPEGEKGSGAVSGAISGAAIGNARPVGRSLFSGGVPVAKEAVEEAGTGLPRFAEKAVGRARNFFMPERVEAAVIRFGEDVFEGKSHFDALEKALQRYGGDIDFDAVNLEGFRTNRQNIISRDEALERFGGYTSEALLKGGETSLLQRIGLGAGAGLAAGALSEDDPEKKGASALKGMVLFGLGVPAGGRLQRGVTHKELTGVADLARVMGVRQTKDRIFGGKSLAELKDSPEALMDVVRQWNTGGEAPGTPWRPEGTPRPGWIKRSPEELMDFALRGKAGKAWYQDSQRALAEFMGDEAEDFIGFVAAHSPNTGPEMNLSEAIMNYARWKRGLPMRGVTQVKSQMARQVAAGEEIASPKVWSFLRNLLGHSDHVTNDIWNMRALAGSTPDQPHGAADIARGIREQGFDYAQPEFDGLLYAEAREEIRRLAANLTQATGETWTPMEAQAALWTGFRDSFNRGKKGLSPRVVPADEVEHFGTLINKAVRRNDPAAPAGSVHGLAFPAREPGHPTVLGEMMPSPRARATLQDADPAERVRYSEARLKAARPKLVSVFRALGIDEGAVSANLDAMAAALRKHTATVRDAGTYAGKYNSNLQLKLPEGTPEWKVRAMASAVGMLLEQDYVPYSILRHNPLSALTAIEDLAPSSVAGQVFGEGSGVVAITKQTIDPEAGNEIARTLKQYQDETGVELNFSQSGDRVFFGDFTFSDMPPREFAEHVSEALGRLDRGLVDKYINLEDVYYVRTDGDYLGAEWDNGKTWEGIWRDALKTGATQEPEVSGFLSPDLLRAHYDRLGPDFTKIDRQFGAPGSAAGATGALQRQVAAGLTGAGVGGLLGAGYDEENRVRGAIAGAVAGGGAAVGLDHFAKQIAEGVVGAEPRPRPGGETLEGALREGMPEATAGGKAYEREELFGKIERWDEGEKQTLQELQADPTGERILERQMEETGKRFDTSFKEKVTWAEGRKMARDAGLDPDLMDMEGMSRMQMTNILDRTKTNAKQMRDIELQLQGRDPADPSKVAEPLLPTQQKALEEQALALENQNIALFSRFMRMRTEFGRALNSLKQMAEYTRLPNGDLDSTYWIAKAKKIANEAGFGDLTDEMVKEVKRLAEAGEEEEMIQFVAMLRQADVGKQVSTLWKAGLLTNPVTHVRNLVGNTTMMTLEAAKDRPAYILDRIFSTLTGNRTIGAPGHGGTLFGFKEGVAETKDIMRGKAPVDLKKVDQVMETDVNLPFLPKTMKDGREVNWFLDTYQKSVYRALAAGDKPFRKASFHRSLREQANLMAETAGETAEYWMKNPTDEMALRAIADSELAIFVNKGMLGQMGSGVKRTAHRFGPVPGMAAEYVLPFTATPANIVSRVVEYAGLGYVGMIYDLARALAAKGGEKPGSFFSLFNLQDAKAAQRRAAQRGGRATVGLTAITAGYLAHKAGWTTGEYPESSTARAVWRETGKEANALMVPGSDMWRSTEGIAPLGNLFNFGAQIGVALDQEQDRLGAVQHATMGIPRLAVEQSFLRGVQQTLDWVTAGETGMGSFTSKRAAQNFGSSLVPNVFRAGARAADPIMREREIEGAPFGNVRGGIMASTPFLSRTMPPKRDMFGYERTRLHDPGVVNRVKYGVGQFMNPLRSSPDLTQRYETSAVVDELGYAAQTLPRMREYGETQSEYQQRQMTVGKAVMDEVEKLIAKSSWENKSKEDRLEAWKAAISAARTKANKPFRDRYKKRETGPPS